MPATNCPACGAHLAYPAATCPRCGAEQPQEFLPRTAWPPAPGLDPAHQTPQLPPQVDPGSTYPLFPVSMLKFILLSLCTFGIYRLYWCYQNWKRIQAAFGEPMEPFWRTFFAPLWNFSLYSQIEEMALKRQLRVWWPPYVLASVGLVLGVLWRLPAPWSLLTYLGVFPYLPVVSTVSSINALHKDRVAEPPNHRFTAWNWVTVIIGGPLFILAMLSPLLKTP